LTHCVTVRYSDGATKTMMVEEQQSVLNAAEASGVPIVSACQSGVCGTCVGRCSQGTYELGQSIGLNLTEKAQRYILTCQTHVTSDCTIELDYPLGRNAARLVTAEAVVSGVSLLSPSCALLTLEVSNFPEKLEFKPGQFAELAVPGCDAWRSYSFAHAPREDATVEFLIRLLPTGAMSDYLRTACRPGDRIAVRGSKGEFYLRDVARPVVLIAGGTGLSATLAIAEQLVRDGCRQPIRLNYGVTHPRDLVLLHRLQRLEDLHSNFSWRTIVRLGSPDWAGRIGEVTDLLEDTELNSGDVDIYLCGPQAMVDAARDWLKHHRLNNANVYFEKFTASGTRSAGPPAQVSRLRHVATLSAVPPAFDTRQVQEEGRGTAVVIGGSIAGIAAAKVLTETFRKVIVIEKDPIHHRMEGRPGAAQGWHLHHLLIAGQRQLETIFPGVIDDMVRAGAFKVDMGEQYRLMIAGSWKKVGPSGVEIVCAGRPLLEWCLRRRLDSEVAIDYRYESEVKDLLYCGISRSVIGVEVERGGEREIVPAQLVVDASGKNTPVPAALARLGIEPPAVEEDHINCFYSTMQHRVDPEHAWRDRVMVICYAYRPQQQYYAAQYFTDHSRTILSTTLAGYNFYGPPRNAEEFREFARRMPSQAIGNEIDGLEPCSPVFNFRYPTMHRYRYEDMKDPPSGLVVVGDSFCSADPVSGAGMSKAMLELAELRGLLRSRGVGDRGFARAYYRKAARIADRVWSVIREQNLRFPWIQDVKQKRPFYFRAQNWYVDRVFECMHEDACVYGVYLAVSHFIAPSIALLRPAVVARVLGRWLKTVLKGDQTLIKRNFGNGRTGEADSAVP